MTDIKKKTILLVEDEAILAMTEKKALEKCGYSVLTTNTGEKAIELFKQNKEIDLILMDIGLSGALDGSEAAVLLQKIRMVPIVFLSSHTESEIIEKIEKTTSYGFVLKHAGISILDASIKMAFRLFDANKKNQAITDKLQTTLDALPDLMFEVDLDGYCYDLHSSHPELLYEKASECIGRLLIKDLPCNVSEKIISALYEANEKGSSSGTQYELTVPAGKRWFEISVSRMMSDTEKPHFIFLSRDITERKQTEEQLRQSSKKMESNNCCVS